MMKFYSLLFAVLFYILLPILSFSQNTPVTTTSSYFRLNNEEVLLRVKASITENARVYSAIRLSDQAPSSELVFDSATLKILSGALAESPGVRKANEPLLENVEVAFFSDSVIWQQKIRLASTDSAVVEGKANLFIQQGDVFDSKEKEFTIVIPAVAIPKQNLAASEMVSADSIKGAGYGKILLKGFAEGLLAFLMPCIFAMLPVTVSFFLKRSKTKKQGVKNALAYAGSIVVIFAGIGVLFGLLGNPRFANEMASSAWFNIFVFSIFLIFGIAFLGAFEITLPSAWVNKIDSKANNNSFAGIFFMALTLVIVSFSCTAPFIGDLAYEAIKNKEIGKAIAGFGAFGFAIALPFAIGAMFPSVLNHISKSGGWLNSLKVSLGFIELALALKFLSSADLAYHWRLLDREVYLALWIVIFGLLGLYLLGKLKLKHDDDLPKNDYGHPYLTVTRLFFAIAALSFTFYLIPGLWGAPLKGISAWLPEMSTQDFNLNKLHATPPAASSASGSKAAPPVKYTDFLKSEIPGVTAYFDYNEGMEAARKTGKPLMIDFTGHSCANCRDMEQNVLVDEPIMKTLQEDFIVVSLYVDDKFRLSPSEWTISKLDGSTLKELGSRNLEFQINLVNKTAQPFYVFLDHSGKIIREGVGVERDKAKFLAILEEAKKNFIPSK
ncbi:MAG: thioredoxin family protein [Chitinophagaceae bacterium]|nr:thioredoxin family protein [Chitinophagaceae bacterium]